MPRGVPKTPRSPKPKQIWGKFPPPQTMPNQEMMTKILKTPINIIRYLQGNLATLTQERDRLIKHNEQLATDANLAVLAQFLKPPPDVQQLVEMNRQLITLNQQLSTQIYLANQALEAKTRDCILLTQGSNTQMEENVNLKKIIEVQNQEIWKLRNPMGLKIKKEVGEEKETSLQEVLDGK